MPRVARDKWLQRSASDYAQGYNHLLPTGMAWNRQSDSVLQKVVRGLSGVWGSQVEALAALLLTIESDPRQTAVLLPDWERAWGLPDPCVKELLTIADRRNALVKKMTLLGAQSREFFIAVAADAGYDITIREFSPFMCGVSQCGDTSLLEIEIANDITSELLLHFNDTDKSTNFIDSSGINHSVIPFGDVQIDTTQKKFGVSSALFDGSSWLALGTTPLVTTTSASITLDILTIADVVTGNWSAGQSILGVGIPDQIKIVEQLTGEEGGAGTYRINVKVLNPVGPVAAQGGLRPVSFIFGTNDFEIDFWFYPNTTNTVIYDSGSGLVSGALSILTENNRLVVKIDDVIKLSGTTSLSPQWYHGTLSRFENNFYLFLNGFQEAAPYAGFHYLMAAIAGPFIGARAGTGSYYNGWLDEFRVVSNNAEHIIDFELPVAPYESYVPPKNLHYRWEIGRPEMRFYWVINVNALRYSWFRASSGQAGVDPHLRIGLATDLECLLRRWKPAHTEVVFDYSPMSGLDYSKTFDATYLLFDIP